MAKTNFQYEKRQRELAKKKKKEEKLQRKTTPDGVAVEGEEGIEGSGEAVVDSADAPAVEPSTSPS